MSPELTRVHRERNLSPGFLNEVELQQAFLVSLVQAMSGHGADNESVPEAIFLVDSAMLSERQLRIVYDVITSISKEGGKLDRLILERALLDRCELESIGGRVGLLEILGGEHTPGFMLEYAERIAASAREQARHEQDAAVRRQFMRIADRIRVEVSSEEFSASAMYDWLVQEAQATHSHSRSRRGMIELLTEEELASLKPPEMLIGDILVRGGLAVLVGGPGAGKTFLALDWALAIRSGLPWMGHDVQQGSVVYVSGEGSGGLAMRLRAWEEHRNIRGETGLFTIARPVDPSEPSDVAQLLSAIDRMIPEGPCLVVFDTLARCLVGGDENSASDMGRFVDGLDCIREATGAAVLILHHPNASGERERGSTALRGAADTTVFLTAKGRRRTLSCLKQKDMPAFKSIQFDLRRCGGSAVLVPIAGVGASGPQVTGGQLTALRSLQGGDLEKGMTSGTWMDATGMPSSTFHNYRKHLLDIGLVECEGSGRSGWYRLSENGRQTLAEYLQRDSKLSPSGGSITTSPTGGLSPMGEPALEELEATA